MMISTRGRYALRVLIDIAEHDSGGYIPLKEIAERQGISLKYIERIIPVLKKNKLVESIHGKGGGYKLSASPEKYKVKDILTLTEGSLAPVACLEHEPIDCARANECITLDFWRGLYDVINQYVDSVTLEELVNNEKNTLNFSI